MPKISTLTSLSVEPAADDVLPVVDTSETTTKKIAWSVLKALFPTHALATAANDFLVASGAGTFVKKTLAEVKTILGLAALAYKATVGSTEIDAAAVTYAKIQNVSATDKVLGRSSAGAGSVEEIACTSAGRALIDDANAAAQRATLSCGYCLPIVGAGSVIWPADGQTLYVGWDAGNVDCDDGSIERIYIPRAGIIKAVYFTMYSSVHGSGESISAYIRLNNTTDTLIAAVASTANMKVFSNTGLSISVAQGDYVNLKLVFPTFATNPEESRMGGIIYIE